MYTSFRCMILFRTSLQQLAPFPPPTVLAGGEVRPEVMSLYADRCPDLNRRHFFDHGSEANDVREEYCHLHSVNPLLLIS